MLLLEEVFLNKKKKREILNKKQVEANCGTAAKIFVKHCMRRLKKLESPVYCSQGNRNLND